MIEEMTMALPDVGVIEKFIYRGTFFAARHDPDPAVAADIRDRFVATDLFSAYAHRRGVDLSADSARTGRSGTGDPLTGSDLQDLTPAFLAHHFRHGSPAPIKAERPRGRR